MYELGKFAVYGIDEPEPLGYITIKLLPHSHYAAFPWWSSETQACLEAMYQDFTGKKVLDFGCGASAILSIAIAKLGGTPYPVEIHPELAEIAQKQLAANGQTIDVMSAPSQDHYDYAVANIGDAELVGRISKLADHGIGTDKEGAIIKW